MAKFAEIYINKKIYTYAVPDEAKIGCAVAATLRHKPYSGYILRFVAEPDFKTIPIQKITAEPSFDENLVKLAYWVADYYKCFPETAVKLILPK
ncbi:hypothetical protein NO2_0107 [Candidatus Termititenax persephonae]|uniref:Primosomal protein N' 3' DNA-binding domain-containing protein n=1 Tax=Candidatus Termititenax persephonae TaxID=2218525 RepID=A0A388TF24_9BACT|nr:hypothetical protein NO2_0107 [Candidatus Termititenax persephonae]